jgi:hypothetical protein
LANQTASTIRPYSLSSVADLLDLLAKLPPYSFVVPDEVVKEVREPEQTEALQSAISSGVVEVVQLDDPAELTIYAELVKALT